MAGKAKEQVEQEEVNKMSIILVLLILWITGIAGIFIMRKIQPENIVYPIWVAFVCIAITAFLVWYGFRVQ